MSRDQLIRKLQSGILTLPAGIIAGTLYAIACWGARQISLDQFFLPSGIRVAALLISPVRMWPYLLLGEYAYFVHLRLPLVGTYGLDWILLSSAYQFPIVALIVHLHREAMEDHLERWLLPVSAAAALVIGIGNLILMNSFQVSPPPGSFLSVASRLVFGHYVAILTAAPLALLWVLRKSINWSTWREPPSACAAAFLLALGVGSTLIAPESYSLKASVLLLMVAPVIALTCLQGWIGAAVGMPIMYVCVRISTPVTGLPGSFDLDSFNVQLVTALSGTALIALGSRITNYYRRFLVHAKADRQAVSNARASHIAGERELRNRVATLNRIGEVLDASLSETINWLRARGHHDAASGLLHVSTVHSRKFREQASMVYPTTLEHVGLYLAIQVGGLGDTWDQTGRIARMSLTGDPCQLSLGLQLTAYRAMSESVSLLLERERGQFVVRARCGRLGSSRGIIVTVGTVDVHHRISRSTSTAVIGRLSGRAQIYSGSIQCRSNRIRMYFSESSAC